MAKVQQLSNIPVCEDDYLLDEGVQTLSYTMLGMKIASHQPKNPCQPVSWQYSMDFNSMIKPNPMSSDVKYSARRDASSTPEYPFNAHHSQEKRNSSSFIKNTFASDSSVDDINTSRSDQPSLMTRNVYYAGSLESLENVGHVNEVTRAQRSEDYTSILKGSEANGSVQSLELKNIKGILRVGDKSKFSRVLDDCPKSKGFKQEAPSTFSRLRIGF